MPKWSTYPDYKSEATIGPESLDPASVTAAKLAANVKTRHVSTAVPTIATTSTTEASMISQVAGTIASVAFVANNSLATSDTAFITWTLRNYGAAGAGSLQALATTPAGINTTKVTGGSAITARVPYQMTLSGTGSNLAVVAGDVLVFTATVTGTLGGTVTGGHVLVVINPS